MFSRRWNVLTLSEYADRLIKREKIPPNVVIITVDDGYRDFYDIAYPELLRAGKKATLFPAVDFINEEWMWWDRISYMVDSTTKKNMDFKFQEKVFNFDLSDEIGKDRCKVLINDYCTKIINNEKLELLSELEKYFEVILPKIPPDEYSSISWEQVKEISRNGVEIGSHTITHPVMTKITSEQVEYELKKSKEYLEAKLDKTVDTFCYPNGKTFDTDESVINHLKKTGYKCAVLSAPSDKKQFDIYRMSRYSAGHDRVDFLWKLSGMEMLLNDSKIKK